MSMKTNSIVALFVALIVILAVNPRMVNNIYSSVLGRLFLIGILIFLSMKSVTLGLLVALTIIAGLNQFGSFTEGLENIDTPTTVGEDNVPQTGQQVVLTNSAVAAKVDSAKQNISDLKAQAQTQVQSQAAGVDKEAIKTAIMAKDSNTMQPDPNMMSNENVEAFTTSMLTPSSLIEGFYGAALY
jgi:hypothetical protein